MGNPKQVLAIVPARGGSKGFPGKNIHPLLQKPLIAWSIECALQSPSINRVIVSTDSEDIARISRQYGAEVPFMRPAQLAMDDTTDLPVYQHTLNWLAQYEKYLPDVIVWLRPTAPLRTSQDIEDAIKLLLDNTPDWVRSVCPVEHHPYWMYKTDDNTLVSFIEGIKIEQYLRRQLLPPAYRLNGAVEVTWRSTIMEKELLYCGHMKAHIMPLERSVDIDHPIDLQIAEYYLQHGKSH
jgi:CMP-N,N'-diacetyllegionaminic acid synthase